MTSLNLVVRPDGTITDRPPVPCGECYGSEANFEVTNGMSKRLTNLFRAIEAADDLERLKLCARGLARD